MTRSTFQLQTALVHAGFDPGPLDNMPGQRTVAAIHAFQTAKGLPVSDAWFGSPTEPALFPPSPRTVVPMVVDLSHYQQRPSDWGRVAAAGIVGIIEKASQGTGGTDPKYAERRSSVSGSALLWGAYHYLVPGSMLAQVDHFLAAARPDDRTRLALDWEDRGVSLEDVKTWLHRCKELTGRMPDLYSGALIKEALGTKPDADLNGVRLWLSQYSASPTWPTGQWPAGPDLWQFTGDGNGPVPHAVPGITDTNIDISSYAGDPAHLVSTWPG